MLWSPWDWSWLLNLSKRNLSILIVEDDTFLKPIMARILNEMYPDVAITWALNTGDAKRILQREWPDLVIIDCLLGNGESGIDVWNYSKRRYPDIPFIMMSGLSQSSIERLSSMPKEKLPPLIQKPFVVRNYKELIKNVLEEGVVNYEENKS